MSKCKSSIFILLALSAVFTSAASEEAKDKEESASEREKRVCEFRAKNRASADHAEGNKCLMQNHL